MDILSNKSCIEQSNGPIDMKSHAKKPQKSQKNSGDYSTHSDLDLDAEKYDHNRSHVDDSNIEKHGDIDDDSPNVENQYEGAGEKPSDRLESRCRYESWRSFKKDFRYERKTISYETR